MAEHDIGEVLVGPPDKEQNVVKWQDFLKKPENLATALVLLAGVTGPRDRGQTKLNKTLVSGVGALGFRGGLEKGFAATELQGREEQRTIDQQNAELAAGQAVTAQGATRNTIAQQQANTLQQQVQQQAQPRPINPSEKARNIAQAGAFDAQAQALGQKNEQSLSFENIFAENLATALELSRDGTVDQTAIALETLKQVEINKLAAIGALTSEIDPITGEEILGFDTDRIPPERLGEFRHLIPIPDKPGDDVIPTDDELSPSQVISKSLRVGGAFVNSALGQETTVRVMRKQGDFEELTNDEILDVVATTRKQIQDKETLKNMEVEQLEELLTVYGRVLSLKERSAIRAVIRKKTGSVQRQINLIGTGSRQGVF